jgi:hypothetical protein
MPVCNSPSWLHLQCGFDFFAICISSFHKLFESLWMDHAFPQHRKPFWH